MKHNKHYWELDRNKPYSNSPNDQYSGKTISGGLENDNRVPEYYRGKEGYQARKVCDNFDLPYHLATAATYILRAYKKHDTPVDCIKKAIAHLEFELEKINNS